MIAFVNDRDVAALMTAAAAAVPALATALFSYLEKRRSDAGAVTPAVKE